MLPRPGAPYTRENIENIEMVQRRAARWVTIDYSTYSSVSNMLSNLGWRSLENRRYDGLVAIPVPSYFEQPKRYTRHMHPLSFKQIHTSVCYHKYSFLTIVLWNRLPADLVQVSDLDSFKSGVSQINHTLP